jgi:hypothetical protein
MRLVVYKGKGYIQEMEGITRRRPTHLRQVRVVEERGPRVGCVCLLDCCIRVVVGRCKGYLKEMEGSTRRRPTHLRQVLQVRGVEERGPRVAFCLSLRVVDKLVWQWRCPVRREASPPLWLWMF